MTDTLRATLGLSLPDTAPRVLLTTTPTHVPVVELDFGTRGQITVYFGPNPANESRNGLPPGCLGVVLQARTRRGPWSNPVQAACTTAA